MVTSTLLLSQRGIIHWFHDRKKNNDTFDKTHTGFNGGTFVYYYFECRNSKYTTKTNVTYTIVKR